MKPITFLIALALWFTTGATLAAQPLSDISVIPEVIASGEGVQASVDYSIVSTVGQSEIGSAGSVEYDLCSGYWCGISRLDMRIYLPLLRRA